MMTAKRTDPILLMVTLILLCIGLAMVYSTSAVVAHERYQDSLYFFKRQFGWTVFGLLFMWAAWYVPYRVQQRLILPLLGCILVALLLVFVPGIGKEVGGARRWLAIGPLSLQPSEFAKYVLIVYAACVAVGQQRQPKRESLGYAPHLVLLAGFAALILYQPDFGTAVVLITAITMQLIVAGLPWRYLASSLFFALIGLMLAVIYEPYRLKRLMTFLYPSTDPQGGGYQALQSLLALGRGGFFGTGLGRGQQKLFYLPEAHTDFIFAVIGEELGFLGAAGLVLLFLVLLWRIMHITVRCGEPFGTVLGLGVFFMLAVQILMNLGVVVGLLPTKGLPLPLISLGGSNLCVSLVAIGTMLNIAQEEPGRSRQVLHAAPVRHS